MAGRSHDPSGWDAPRHRTFWGYDRPVWRDPMFWIIGTLCLAAEVVALLVGRTGPVGGWELTASAVATASTTLTVGVLAGVVREFVRGRRERPHLHPTPPSNTRSPARPAGS